MIIRVYGPTDNRHRRTGTVHENSTRTVTVHENPTLEQIVNIKRDQGLILNSNLNDETKRYQNCNVARNSGEDAINENAQTFIVICEKNKTK